MKTLEEIRAQLRAMRGAGIKWESKEIAEAFPGVHIMTLWRIMVDNNYIPRRDKLRDKLGLPRYVLVEEREGYKIRHEKLNRNHHGNAEVRPPVEVRCPNCNEVFPYKNHRVKKQNG